MHFDSNLSAAHLVSTEALRPKVTEFLVKFSLLSDEREIYGLIDENNGEFSPLPETTQHQESNQFNKQSLKMGSKHLYLLVDARRTVVAGNSISHSEQKLILTHA